MDLPRFTSGQIGNLSYAHLNEAFQLLDRLRPLLVNGADFEQGGEGLLVARITGTSPTTPYLMTWEEVVLKDATAVNAAVGWQVRDGGRTSNASSSTEFEPAFQPPLFNATTSTALPSGTVALLRRMKRLDGKKAWMVVNSVSAPSTQVFPAEITGYQSRPAINGQIYQFLYSWREVYIDDAPSTGFFLEWLPVPGGRVACFSPGCYPPAFNGAERKAEHGLGGTGPAGANERNAPVGNGTVVMMSTDPVSGLYYFSLGPATSISCQTPPP